MHYGSTALLPTGTNINLHAPETNDYFSPDLTYYVLRDGNKTRIASSYGEPEAAWAIGTVHTAHHDQAGYLLGVFTVVGYRTPDGELHGDVPTRKHSLAVFK